MKISITALIIIILLGINAGHANEVRMQTLMVPDLIDDPANITVFPHHINQYANCLWGDIKRTTDEDFGLILAPASRLGALAVWQQSGNLTPGFNFGYGRGFYRFDLGLAGMTMNDHKHFSIGVGRVFFSKRIDLSFQYNDDLTMKWYRINQRTSVRRGDYVLAYRYAYWQHREPLDYLNHKIALLIQRLVLSEGFVYAAAEYNINRGAYENDYLDLYAGVEMPLSRVFLLRLGMKESLNADWEPISFSFEPGLGVRIRDFKLDFQFNKNRLQDKEETLVNSFGVELNFGEF